MSGLQRKQRPDTKNSFSDIDHHNRVVFKRVETFIFPPLLDAITGASPENTNLLQAREQALSTVTRMTAIIGLVGLLVAAHSLIVASKIGFLLMYASLLAVLWGVTLMRRIKYQTRATIIIVCWLTSSILGLIGFGWSIFSLILLINFSVTSTMFGGERIGAMALGVSLSLIIMVGFLSATGRLLPLAQPDEMAHLLTVEDTILTLLFFTMTVGGVNNGIIIVLRNMERALALEIQESAQLEQERALLEFRVAERTRELSQAYEQAQQARHAAETASQAKSVFLANMSHELRTPLNAVLGFTQLMGNDANLTPAQQENLAIVGRNGEHLLALINDVLTLSRIESEIQLSHGAADHQIITGLAPGQHAPDGGPYRLMVVGDIAVNRHDAQESPALLPLSLPEAAVSAEWQAELHQTATQGDMEWLTALVEQIQLQAPVLAQQLREWVEAFEYNRILELFGSKPETL